MSEKSCQSCGKKFLPWPQIRNQKFCSNPECQRERRRRRQAERRTGNPEQKSSDAQYFQDWSAKNPDYWKQYGLKPERRCITLVSCTASH